MKIENYRWLAGVIAAHEDRKLVGRTRLQKEIKLLQSLGLPSTYRYKTHFYGPYSEGLQADIDLITSVGLVNESEQTNANETQTYYVFEANEEAELPSEAFDEFQAALKLMEKNKPVILELAATYVSFREMGEDHESALERLRLKKGKKCGGGNEVEALALLDDLGLPHS